ncbi:hypothetical protein [Apilactobacillus timberlakei]|uniref:hypothetical protein n=1 Tax=Apilactobacillus timberlakei TaxID=2008380 RepID=UPI001125B3A8|nr:hypothetical protein [Apilactobacillus timberlakei]TPR19191.1 hypothetical protein DYZ95_00825 [Apilactobacillus timberlakei]
MKFRNLLSLSAVTLMSLGLTIGATGLSASAAGTTPAPTTPSTNQDSKVSGDANVGPFNLDSVNAVGGQQWSVADSSINLGKFNLNFSNGTHSYQNYTVTPSVHNVSLMKNGSTLKTSKANIVSGEKATGKSDLNKKFDTTTDDINISLDNANDDYGLIPGENGVTYSTDLTWNFAGATPSNPSGKQ